MRFLFYILSPLLFIISCIYGFVIFVRNKLYDYGIYKSYTFNIPVVCVGNITVGGTGKTPHIEYLISLFCKRKKIAVLSRGYKRKTKGFRYVNVNDSAEMVGDEPLQIKNKFPETVVMVDAKREEGIKRLQKDYPDLDLILLDDAFQYRKVKANINIVLIDYNRPVWRDFFLPLGRLRDSKTQMQRANIVVVSKCPENITEKEKSTLIKKLKLKNNQKVYFTCYGYGKPLPVFYSNTLNNNYTPEKVLAIAGIASPKPFFKEIEKRYKDTKYLDFPDHHNFTENDINNICKQAEFYELIITTEKDSIRFKGLNLSDKVKSKFYYLPIFVKKL